MTKLSGYSRVLPGYNAPSLAKAEPRSSETAQPVTASGAGQADTQAEILFAFHGIGREYRGLIAVSACFFRRELTDDGERQVTDLTPLTDDIFQVNYREAPAQAEMRFRQWFEVTLTKGLEMWRQGL